MNLGNCLCAWREQTGLSVRDLAKEIGCSAATLNRVEHGMPCDSVTITKIFLWLLGEKK